jgi:hypothetical protein
MNVNEFERLKPVVTMQKLNELIKLIDEERVNTENPYRDRVRSLDDISILLKETKKSFVKGE